MPSTGPHPISRAGIVSPRRISLGLGLAMGLVSLLRIFVDERGVRRFIRGWPNALPPPRCPKGLRETLGAIVDAVVPAGPAGPDLEPGAREAGTVEFLLRPAFPGLDKIPTLPYLLAVAFVADLAALLSSGRRFRALPSEARSRLFGRLLGWFPSLFLPVQMVASFVFASGVIDRRGVEWLGIPAEVDLLPPGEGTGGWRPVSATSKGSLP
ncbi:MAG: hypothetical protein HY720_27515 [Planctomycetes bacterium]|nr:hypothetical protein [Planctomycetota bacterium]